MKNWMSNILNFGSMSVIVQQDATMYRLIHFCKLLYMFWMVITVISVPDDGWSYHPKHAVEQFKEI
jgi:hypothetical protein